MGLLSTIAFRFRVCHIVTDNLVLGSLLILAINRPDDDDFIRPQPLVSDHLHGLVVGFFLVPIR